MERLEFDCNYDLVDKIGAILEEIDNDYPVVSVYGKYDVIKTLLEDLIVEGFSISSEIQLEDYEISHYDKEFVLYVKPSEVSVEKVFAGDTYYYGSGNVSFVHEDCSSTLLKYIESDKVYEFGYSENCANDNESCDDEFCCDCCKSNQNTEYSVKTDDNGYTISVKYNLDASEAEKIIQDMERRMEHMNNMFKDMDNFRRMFRW